MWQMNRICIVCFTLENKLRKFPPLLYRKQGKQFFSNLPAGFG